MKTWALVVPRGEWVSEYPTTNGRIILGIRLAGLFVGFVLALVVVILSGRLPEKIPWDVVANLLEMLAWFIVGMMGLSIAQYVGKRATTNPETLKAVTEAKIAMTTGSYPAAVPLADMAPKAEAKQPESEKG